MKLKLPQHDKITLKDKSCESSRDFVFILLIKLGKEAQEFLIFILLIKLGK